MTAPKTIKDARSVNAQAWGDQMNITLNVRFLINIIIAVATLAFSYHKVVSKIDSLVIRVSEAEEQLDELQSLHDAEVEELKKWYNEFSINPFKKRK